MRRRRAVAADTPPEKADPTNPKVEKTVYPRPKFNNLLERKRRQGKAGRGSCQRVGNYS